MARLSWLRRHSVLLVYVGLVAVVVLLFVRIESQRSARCVDSARNRRALFAVVHAFRAGADATPADLEKVRDLERRFPPIVC